MAVVSEADMDRMQDDIWSLALAVEKLIDFAIAEPDDVKRTALIAELRRIRRKGL